MRKVSQSAAIAISQEDQDHDRGTRTLSSLPLRRYSSSKREWKSSKTPVQAARHSDAAHGETRARGSGQNKMEERPRRDGRVVGSKQYHKKDTRRKRARREKEGQELTRANSLESPPPTLPDMVPAATNHFVLLPRRVDAARPGSSLLQTIL